MQAVLLLESLALPLAGRPGRRWALQIVCSPLPTPVSESEEHDSPHFPICCGRRLGRVGSWQMPTGPLAQDGGRDDDAVTPTQVPRWRGKGGSEPTDCCAGSLGGVQRKYTGPKPEPRAPAQSSANVLGSLALGDKNVTVAAVLIVTYCVPGPAPGKPVHTFHNPSRPSGKVRGPTLQMRELRR